MSATATIRHAAPIPGRSRSGPSVTPADIRAAATGELRRRWPALNVEYVVWRVLARSGVAAGHRSGALPTWTRSAVYELVVEDQRADRGQTAHAVELDALLREIAAPRPSIDRRLLTHALVNLHPDDVTMLRLLLAGHRFDAVARRVGVPVGAVELAYGRVRTRLRATVDSDPALRLALRQTHELLVEFRLAQLRSRPRPRRVPRDRLDRPAQVDAG